MKWSTANTKIANFNAPKPSIFYKLKAEAFEDLSAHPFYCEDCPHFTELKDVYGTGDSPSEYGCEGTFRNCLRLVDMDEAIEDRIRNKLHELADSDLAPLMEALKRKNAFANVELFLDILLNAE